VQVQEGPSEATGARDERRRVRGDSYPLEAPVSAKVGRPRMDAGSLSKWGAWKRGQRELPSRPGYIRHHLQKGTYGPPTTKNTRLVKRTEHPKLHRKP